MKKACLYAFLGLIGFTASLRASESFNSDTKTIVVSTIPTSPTQLMSYSLGAFIQKNIIYNNSGFYLYVSTYSTTITTGAATGSQVFPFIPSSTTPVYFDQEFPQDMNGGVYQGSLYGVLASTNPVGASVPTPQPISIWRFK
jgi:hypothetical protein